MKSFSTNAQKDNCLMPFREISIKSNGDIVLCCYDITGKFILGNIEEISLKSLWNSSKYQDIRKNMLNKHIDNLPITCKGCRIFTNERLIKA